MGSNTQKIAEFNKLKNEFDKLSDVELVKKISEYRNIRIRTTVNLHKLEKLIYHVIIRIPHMMEIYESPFDMIDIDNINNIRHVGNNIYFTDNIHKYHFNTSKSTLYMHFQNLEFMDSFEIDIIDDPYEFLESSVININKIEASKPTLCLKLYSVKSNGEKYVPLKSGLNQWNGSRKQYNGDKLIRETPRNPDELYIPYPVIDRKRSQGFFPPRDVNFDLRLPDGKWIKAKVCQQDGKAIMSNPNSDLGKWLLRDVFELDYGTIITYPMLCRFGIDCAVFTKEDEYKYSIDFGTMGTYEERSCRITD